MIIWDWFETLKLQIGCRGHQIWQLTNVIITHDTYYWYDIRQYNSYCSRGRQINKWTTHWWSSQAMMPLPRYNNLVGSSQPFLDYCGGPFLKLPVIVNGSGGPYCVSITDRLRNFTTNSRLVKEKEIWHDISSNAKCSSVFEEPQAYSMILTWAFNAQFAHWFKCQLSCRNEHCAKCWFNKISKATPDQNGSAVSVCFDPHQFDSKMTPYWNGDLIRGPRWYILLRRHGISLSSTCWYVFHMVYCPLDLLPRVPLYYKLIILFVSMALVRLGAFLVGTDIMSYTKCSISSSFFHCKTS